MHDAKKVYLDAKTYVVNKKMKISQKLRVFTENMLYQLDLEDDTDIIILGEWPTEQIRKTFHHFSRVHFMGSVVELDIYLQRRKSIVVLDCDYLEQKTIELCSIMANDHPQNYLLLLMNNVPQKLISNEQIVTFDDFTEKINRLLTSQQLPLAHKMGVEMILSLAQAKYWTFALEIFQTTPLAKVFIENGHIAKIIPHNSKNVAMEALTSQQNTWKTCDHIP